MITRTTTALLEGLEDPANDAVWREFDGRYRPVLLSLARRLGLSAEDAADAAQETLVRFVRCYREGRYDRRRGRLRSWITGIARHCIAEVRAARGPAVRAGSHLDDLPGEDELAAWWDAECEREILRRAMDELRERTGVGERTIAAFARLALDGAPAADVARELEMTMNDVYLAKHRCLRRLREIVARFEALYEVA